ncbi:MAG TPA: PspA/IM30 family protein [Thermomicrobiales bacterium]|nr:PspA/IM30 family protein [Thermomicrobiales bacterium]
MSRFTGFVKGRIDALLAPPPDPRAVDADAGERQQSLLAEVRRALADLKEARHRLRTKATLVEGQLPRFEEQARQALRSGREDLARLALQRRQAALTALRELDSQAREIETEEGKLAIVEQRLTVQIEGMAARRHLLEARYSAAEAQVKIGEALTGISGELAELGIELERAERRTGRMQARAAAIEELVAEGVLHRIGTDPTSGMTEALDRLDDERVIDARLAALKQELAGEAGAADPGRADT